MSTTAGGPAVDLADDTWLAVAPALVARQVADPARWRGWWPDLHLQVSRDRGLKGQQWVVRSRTGRPGTSWVGSMEIWLEPWHDGVLLHHYARLDAGPSPTGADPPATGAVDAAAASRERERRVRAWKRSVHALKDELEVGREPGTAAVVAAG